MTLRERLAAWLRAAATRLDPPFTFDGAPFAEIAVDLGADHAGADGPAYYPIQTDLDADDLKKLADGDVPVKIRRALKMIGHTIRARHTEFRP